MDTKITEVNEGTQESYRSDKYFENITDASKEEVEKIRKSSALQVVCDNSAEVVINLPISRRVSPKSKLAMFKKTYGDYPKVGMKVVTKTDESTLVKLMSRQNGFFRIVLEAS